MGAVTRCLLAAGGVAAMTLVGARTVSSHNPVTTTVQFNREVAAILNQRCSHCHVAQGMAMPLLSYADARPWAVAIKEEILARRMPPWPAERGYGAFANDNGLTQREQEFLISWIDGGTPEGDGAPPQHIDHGAHWMLGEPDAIREAQPIASVVALKPDSTFVSTEGVARFTIDPQLRAETWVRAFDFKAADPRRIRAAFFSVSGSGDYLGGWTPWRSSTALPDGTALRLRANARINVDIAYTGADPPAAGGRLGLYVAPSPQRQVDTLVMEGQAPPDQRRVAVSRTLGGATSLVGLRLDLSDGATGLELKAMRPDGSFEPLLWIRDYRRDWPMPFVFRGPVALPRGSVLTASAHFDPGARTTRRVRIVLNAYRPPS